MNIRELAVLAIAIFAGDATGAPAAAGDWLGTLDFGMQKLRIVFHIKSDAEGRLSATADSPDQGAKGLPVGSISQTGNSIEIRMANLGASFAGTINEGGNQISGTFQQGGAKVPLTLRRMKQGDVESSAPKRPQVPKPPYPYEEKQVEIVNTEAKGVRLAGTLTLPKGDGPFPSAVLVTGSGPQTRNEEVAGHPVFHVIADYLTRRGIAVLRYDDRGVGKSTGSFAEATTVDFASDAAAAVEFLKAQDRINSKRVGVIGHSEGANVAAMLGARRDDLAYLVLLAPMSVPGREVILEQKAAILRANGATSVNLSADRKLYDLIIAGRSEADLRQAAAAMLKGLPEPAKEQQLRFLLSPWFRFFLTYDPAVDLAKVKTRTLVLFGERDLQVLPAQNRIPLELALKKAGNERVRIEVLPGLNHLFQPAKTGSPTEYAAIEETFSPKALEVIADWIK